VTCGRGRVHELERLNNMNERGQALVYERFTLISKARHTAAKTAEQARVDARKNARQCQQTADDIRRQLAENPSTALTKRQRRKLQSAAKTAARSQQGGEARAKVVRTQRQASKFTWTLTRAQYDQLRAQATRAASLRDPTQANALVQRMNYWPGFNGIRLQREKLYRAMVNARVHSHGSDAVRDLTDLRNGYLSFNAQKLVHVSQLAQWYNVRNAPASVRRLVRMSMLIGNTATRRAARE